MKKYSNCGLVSQSSVFIFCSGAIMNSTSSAIAGIFRILIFGTLGTANTTGSAVAPPASDANEVDGVCSMSGARAAGAAGCCGSALGDLFGDLRHGVCSGATPITNALHHSAFCSGSISTFVAIRPGNGVVTELNMKRHS